ncbi:unnamed protein product, partial [Cladocopium goreaui]
MVSMAGPEQSIPHENLEEYFEELRNPLFENTIRRFFTDVSKDCNWCLIEAPKEGTPTSRDMYAKRFQDASKFVFELLSAFGISPVCNVCPGQDGRAGYVLHVCGVNHFKYLAEKLSKDRVRCKDSKELQRQYEHSWTFVLGQVIINYLTGEVRVKRRPSFIGIQVRKAQDLPTIEEWYCVGTQLACPMNDDLQWEHWTDKWPTTNGGKPRWRTVIKKSAERLVELLEAHGISEHSCQICPNQHGMWANHLGGPKHYSHLYNGPNLENSTQQRYQTWDLPDVCGVGIVGRLMFDHISGMILMIRSQGRLRHEVNYPLARGSEIIVHYSVQDSNHRERQHPTEPNVTEQPQSATCGHPQSQMPPDPSNMQNGMQSGVGQPTFAQATGSAFGGQPQGQMPVDPTMLNGMQQGVGQSTFTQAAGSPFGGQPQRQMPPDPATMQNGMQSGVGQPTFAQAAGSAFGGQPQGQMPVDPTMLNGMQQGVGQSTFTQAAGSPFGWQPQGEMPPDPATMQHGMQQGVGQPTFTQNAGSAVGVQPQGQMPGQMPVDPTMLNGMQQGVGQPTFTQAAGSPFGGQPQGQMPVDPTMLNGMQQGPIWRATARANASGPDHAECMQQGVGQPTFTQAAGSPFGGQPQGQMPVDPTMLNGMQQGVGQPTFTQAAGSPFGGQPQGQMPVDPTMLNGMQQGVGQPTFTQAAGSAFGGQPQGQMPGQMPVDPIMLNGMQQGVGQPTFIQAAGSPFGGQPQRHMPPDPATMQHGMQQGVGQPTFTQAAGSAFGGQPQGQMPVDPTMLNGMQQGVGQPAFTQAAGSPFGGQPQGQMPPDPATMQHGMQQATDRYSELMRAFQAKQPGSLYEVYTDPMTGKPWWYDLVTGELVADHWAGFTLLEVDTVSELNLVGHGLSMPDAGPQDGTGDCKHSMAFKPLAVFCLALPIWTWNTWIHGASQCFVNPRPKLPVGPVPPVRHVGPAGAVFRNSTWSARSVGFGTVRFANSAVLLVVAVFLVALKKPAVSAWVGFVMHALTTGIMRGFPCPIKIPVSFRREARSNLAKSYIAQAILLSLVLTSQSPTSAMVSKYLLFVLIFVTSIFFDWPDPPLLDQAPALVFP